MADSENGFNQTATTLSRNPLGIIALFIVLVYAFATLTISIPTTNLTTHDRSILVWFLVLFPVLVLLIFVYLVGWRTKTLYGPSDFADQKDWIALQVRTATSIAVSDAFAEANDGAVIPPDLRTIALKSANTVLDATSRAMAGGGRGGVRRLLWVDDHPTNNTGLVRAFEDLDIKVTVARSTDEALSILGGDRFAAIISDMGREGDPDAGHTLLKAVRERGLKMPFFIFASAAAAKRKDETLGLGGNGSTNRAQELFDLVSRALD